MNKFIFVVLIFVLIASQAFKTRIQSAPTQVDSSIPSQAEVELAAAQAQHEVESRARLQFRTNPAAVSAAYEAGYPVDEVAEAKVDVTQQKVEAVEGAVSSRIQEYPSQTADQKPEPQGSSQPAHGSYPTAV